MWHIVASECGLTKELIYLSSDITEVQGVPYHWIHFVFVNFSGSRAHTEELFIAIG